MRAFSLRRHALSECVRMLQRRWTMFLFGLVLCAGALTLPLLAAIFGYGLVPLVAKVPLGPEVNVFAALSSSRQDVEHLKARIEQMAGVASVQWVARDDALADLARRSGVASLSELKLNPLPDTLIVTLAPATPPAALDAAVASLRKLPKVDGVYADSRWYRRAIGAAQVAYRAGLVVGAIALGVLVLILVGAVRLLAVTTRDELRLYQLVGAERRQIARPYAYAGATMAAAATLLAYGATYGLLLSFEADLRWLSEVLGAPLWPRLPPWPALVSGVAIVAILGGLVGTLTARSAIRRLN